MEGQEIERTFCNIVIFLFCLDKRKTFRSKKKSFLEFLLSNDRFIGICQIKGKIYGLSFVIYYFFFAMEKKYEYEKKVSDYELLRKILLKGRKKKQWQKIKKWWERSFFQVFGYFGYFSLKNFFCDKDWQSLWRRSLLPLHEKRERFWYNPNPEVLVSKLIRMALYQVFLAYALNSAICWPEARTSQIAWGSEQNRSKDLYICVSVVECFAI